MTPKRIPIQAFLPYALPVSLALVACFLVFSGSRKQESHARASAAPAASTAGTRARSADIPESAAMSVSRLMREVPPADARVASLVKSYHSGDGKVHAEEIRKILDAPQGKQLSFTLAGMDLSGLVESRKEEQGSISLSVRLEDELGRFTLTQRPGQRVFSALFFEGESHAFTFRGFPENGQWSVALKSVEHVLCAPLGATYPPERAAVGMPKANDRAKSTSRPRKVVGAPPDLEGDPESSFVLYIDLDGEVVDQPEWTQFNGGQTITALPHARADDVDFVTRMWERVCEDFEPFDINVTTSRAVFDAAAPSRRVMCIATPTDAAAVGAGGVAFLESFGSGLVCWAFNAGEASLAETVSHEVGHTLGLSHDGKINVFEYYGGHGTGQVSWAPIMGAYFADFEPPFVEEELTQWSRGEYEDATNQEDDLQIITSQNGFSYRQDDHGDDMNSASILNIEEDTVNQAGIIARNTDDDWFSFTTSGGNVVITADTTNIQSPDESTRGSNLALSLTLYDGDGNEILRDNPEDLQGASISSSLIAGNYFIKITNEGRKDPSTGFTEYASMGNYFLSGTVPQTGLLQIEPPQANLPRSGGASSFRVTTDRTWSWSTDVNWIESESLKTRTGNGEVRYRVSRNPNRDAREARIVVKTDGYETFHLVKQAGSASDDHGDTFTDATFVTQVSSTPGDLEEPLDIDMFLIEVEGFGDLTVTTSGTTDTYGEFYDSLGNRIASDDDGARPNFTITQRVSTGTYFVSVRHSVRGGIGKYSLECSFKNKPALIINQLTRKVGPAGGRFLLSVVSNTEWTWSSDSDWVQSTANATQERGQQFAYTVDAYNGTKVRKGRITFRNKGNRVVHVITQRPANDDDHSDQTETATELASFGKDKGIIQFEGDSDMFRIPLSTSGTLVVKSTGTTDTVGELLDAKGSSLLRKDDGDGDNFVIQRSLAAGVYYLRISTFGGIQVGAYGVETTFHPSTLLDVTYSAEKGGAIRGASKQSVPLGGNAKTVTAVPKRGYSFVRWSDGLRSERRSDLNLITHLQVTAEFVGTVEVSTRRGKLTHKQMPPLDFGAVALGKSRAIEFTIQNQGKVQLTNINIESTGVSSRNWRVIQPKRKAIGTGQSAKFRIVLRGESPGFFSTQWSIRATGMQGQFIIRTMGVVNSSGVIGSFSGSASTLAASTPPILLNKPANEPPSLPWIDVSPDGYFRYRFERPVDDATEQVFRISADGVSWEEALVLDVWKTDTVNGINHFEAVFAPPLVPAPRILVNESSP